ncbi:MAG: methyltransferase domain-containing protein [Deltaproteobacteria bacterium]|nr:MAG: methyltransferase domain-containing protein [Deltaproteobacteria bacterium]
MPTTEEARWWFAEEIRAVAHLQSDALVAACARVPREAFLGPGPWQIARAFDHAVPYRVTADADPRHLYHDVLVAIDPARQLHNGQPNALARWIEAADIRPGDRVLHVGCGTGYYTAILAELAGPTGRVTAFEVDPALAARARTALATWPTVRVETGDAAAPDGPFDAIFINAGCTHPRSEWLAALVPGGRLVIPLTFHSPALPHGVGGMLRAERRDPRWPAQIVSQVGIYDCCNARDPQNEAELRKLATLGASPKLGSVLVEPHERGDACLAHLPGFCLQK